MTECSVCSRGRRAPVHEQVIHFPSQLLLDSSGVFNFLIEEALSSLVQCLVILVFESQSMIISSG